VPCGGQGNESNVRIPREVLPEIGEQPPGEAILGLDVVEYVFQANDVSLFTFQESIGQHVAHRATSGTVCPLRYP